MEMRQLKCFASVAEYLSFTEAARHLYVAQSAVSQQIAALEKELGVSLFQRNKRSVKLTNAGQVLLKETQFLLSRMNEAVEKARQADVGLIGTLRIGFLGYTERIILPPLIRRFRKLYPQIELKLDQYHHGELIEMLSNEELDIGFTLAFGIEPVSSLDVQTIFQENISVVMHEDHPMASLKTVDLAALASEPFVVINRRESPQGYQQTLQICSNHGFTPRIEHEPRLMQTLLMLVDAGLGISILPLSAQLQASDTLRFIPLKEQQQGHELVAAWKRNNTNPSIPLFLKEIET
ncbi:MAG: LysR substrate-binding domain-containing protein [Bacillota bacterium]|nr:LysR substrate-binding domain-containing protein [Bacillota bacterium]